MPAVVREDRREGFAGFPPEGLVFPRVQTEPRVGRSPFRHDQVTTGVGMMELKDDRL